MGYEIVRGVREEGGEGVEELKCNGTNIFERLNSISI